MSTLLNRIVGLCRPGRVKVYPWAMVVSLICAWLVVAFILGNLPLDANGNFVGNDFAAFYTGARFWIEGNTDELYNLPKQKEFQQEISHAEFDSLVPFLNPPIALLLYAPFSLAGYIPGLLTWWAFGLTAWIVGIELLRRTGPSTAGSGQLLTIALRFFPFVAVFLYGQATGVIFLVWAGTLALLRINRDLLAGLCLSLLAFKPQLALPLVIPLLFAGRIRALAGGAIGLAVAATISFQLFPGETSAWFGFSSEIVDLLRGDGYPRWGLHSLWGFFVLLLDPIAGQLVNVATSLTSLSLLGLLGFIWWREPWQPQSRSWNHCMAASVAVALMMGMHLFLYDLALLLVPFLLIAPYHRCANPNTYLDGGSLLGWTALVWITTFSSSYFVKLQMILLKCVGLPAVGLQVSILAVLGWSWTVYRYRQDEQQQSGPPRLQVRAA